MANFHSNLLVIAANEGDMRKVLLRFASNLVANKDESGFDQSDFSESEPLTELFETVSWGIDSCYWLAFAGAPNGQSLEEGNTVQTTPTTRPSSDTAAVNHTRHGDEYALSICYDTAWYANDEDVDVFFKGLPSGEYGVSFFDADEGDGYNKVNVICVLHHGQAILNSYDFSLDDNVGMYITDPKTGLDRFVGIDEMSEDQFNDFVQGATVCYHGPIKGARELKEEAEDRSSTGGHAIPGLAKLSYSVAVSDWFRYVDYDDWEVPEKLPCAESPRVKEEDEDNKSCDLSGVESNPFSYMGPMLHWEHPDSDEYARIDETILATITRFPWVVGSTGAAYEGREKNVERLIPGQPIKLVADWANLYFNPVAIQTQTASGERLGNLDDRGGGMQLSDNARAALACILPHVRAYADEVEPLMTIWDGHKRNSTVIVRLELTDEPLDNILDEVHELLKRATNRRGVTSVVEEG